MSRASTPPVLARLRTSTRLIALVLLVFLMKVGVVAACATHDFSDASLAAAGQTAHAAASALDTGDDGDPPAPAAHGGCVDCHCHHAATLVAEVAAAAWPMRSAEPPAVAARVHLVAPGQELRPPIL